MKCTIPFRALALAVLALALAAQETREHPLALVLSTREATILRAGSELPLAANLGDVLFAGDTLRGEATLLYCPEKTSLSVRGEVIVEPGALRPRSGRIDERKPVAICALPAVEKNPVASQLHYGSSLTRETAAPSPLSDEKRRALETTLAPIDRALAADPRDLAARVARAAAFESLELGAEALLEYRAILEEWPDAVWVRSRIFVHEKQHGRQQIAGSKTLRRGKTYALLVGISKYQIVPERQWLKYAHVDAEVFATHLRSPRGGSLAESDVVLLTDEKATTAAIRNAFETFLKARATKDDTVVVFIAAHGVVEPGGKRAAYVITHDSDPQDLPATGLPMADVQTLIREDLAKVGHLLVYVDVCRAGQIGAMRGGNAVNKAVEQIAEIEGDLFLFLASGPREVSYEGPQFGGGHGAFSYFLLDAMNGGADADKDGAAKVGEIIEYVREKVIESTAGKQHPRDLGSMERAMVLAEMKLPGITLAKPSPAVAPVGQRGLEVAALDDAIGSRNVLPGARGSAFTALAPLRRMLSREEYLLQENKLRVSLENEGQQVLLRYLSGDQTPQSRDDFIRGAAYFEAARTLTPESLLLEARATFCQGRAAIFDKDYGRAAALLERAARTDPGGAYSFNALGIAYLEQADYARSILAFRDAIRRAPYWAYPRHNLALAYTQSGDYESAIGSYRQAMDLAPQYYYLPYNLGLVYQRLNRNREAEDAFRKSIQLAPSAGDPYNALGYLYASTRRGSRAEPLYRQALEKTPTLLAARQNLAVLLASRRGREDEAISLWRANLEQAADYLPSRLSLARALERLGREADASIEYEALLKDKPDHVAARLALADLHAKAGRAEAALAEVRAALAVQPDNPLILDRMKRLQEKRR